MMQIPFNHFACPLDGLPLEKQGQSLRCQSGHSFDFDKKGAINLLPVQFKKSKHPGDSKEMVIARSQFLDQGFYQPISEQLNLLVKHLAKQDTNILDAGCGEGYYTHMLAQFLKQEKISFALAGLDISKETINAASKRNREISWITGTNANLPILPQSVDVVLSLFGFPVWPEFFRVLKPGGYVITADVGADHLIELRRILYPEIKTKPLAETIPHGFERVSQNRVKESFAVNNPTSIADLLVMTPHGYRATKEKQEEALATTFGAMTLDVVFNVYCAKNSA